LLIDQESLVLTLLRERVKLLAYLSSIVRDHHLAEDLFQEVAVLAVRKIDEIHDMKHLLGWLRLTGRHLALRALRRRRQSPLVDQSVLDLLEEQWSEQDGTPAIELVEALEECLEELSPYARDLVRLRYEDEISGTRLAEVVDRNVNTVYVALSRIHRSLHDCISEKLS
jgi:RNA polymerase sigma-70 factor (ECF subfamily)